MNSSVKPLIDATTDDICWIKSNASSNVYTFQKNDDDLEFNDIQYAETVAAGVVVTIESIGGSLPIPLVHPTCCIVDPLFPHEMAKHIMLLDYGFRIRNMDMFCLEPAWCCIDKILLNSS